MWFVTIPFLYIMRKERKVQTTVFVDQDVIDTLRSGGWNISRIAREALNRKASEVWYLNVLNRSCDVPTLEKLVTAVEEGIVLKEEEVLELKKFLMKRKEELLMLRGPKLDRKKLQPLEARAKFVEDFEKWAKESGIKRERGKKGTDEEGSSRFPIEICERFCNMHPGELEDCMWTPESIEGRPFTDEVDWLRKATSRGKWKVGEDEVDF